MLTQYLKQENGIINFSGPVTSLKKIPPNIYNVMVNDFTGELYLSVREVHTDGIIELPGSPAQVINRRVDEFLSEKVRSSFDRYNMLYKRGVLMYGPPGTGKTSIINILMKTAIKKDMVVLLGTAPHLVPQAVDSIRTIENNKRPVMVIWEELERLVYQNEASLLNLLDGVYQLDNIFYVATTNYIKEIPPRIRNRPSRFAEVLEIGPPNRELRKEFLSAKIHKDDDVNISEWADKTEGLTIDHLKDLIISVMVLGIPLEDAVDKLRTLNRDEDEECSTPGHDGSLVKMEKICQPGEDSYSTESCS